MPTFQTFKDLSVTFKKHPVTDDLVAVKDKAAIVQAITALLLTRRGERPFQPKLGCDVQRVLFEPMDYAAAALIKKEISDNKFCCKNCCASLESGYMLDCGHLPFFNNCSMTITMANNPKCPICNKNVVYRVRALIKEAL